MRPAVCSSNAVSATSGPRSGRSGAGLIGWHGGRIREPGRATAAHHPPVSPVACYGGYHQPSEPVGQSGALQARAVADAAADSVAQRQWRAARDDMPETPRGDSCPAG